MTDGLLGDAVGLAQLATLTWQYHYLLFFKHSSKVWLGIFKSTAALSIDGISDRIGDLAKGLTWQRRLGSLRASCEQSVKATRKYMDVITLNPLTLPNSLNLENLFPAASARSCIPHLTTASVLTLTHPQAFNW